MYKEKHVASDVVTFDKHQLDGWSTDIAQTIRSIEQLSSLVLCLYMKVNKASLLVC